MGVADGGEAVGDDEACSPQSHAGQGALDRGFGFVVHRAGGFIQGQHGRVAEDGAGQGEALALAAAELLPPLTHHGLVALGQL